MAYPQWLTGKGNLGIVPSTAYYEYQLDAYDTAGGTLVFYLLSGTVTLPPGLQITSTGLIRGIPVSTAGPDLNQTYTFTVRVQNLNDGLLADRTFSLTITNVAPPIIVPRNVDLGTYYDGSYIELQLEAVEFILGNNLTWSVKTGTSSLPDGLYLTPSGLLYGYIKIIPVIGPSSTPGWDITDWDGKYFISPTDTDTLGWDFSTGAATKTFDFTIEVSDGARTDVSTYKIKVVPRSTLTADDTNLTADSSISNDTGSRHFPIILSQPDDIPPQRQGGWFAYQINSIDLDGDTLQYSIPALSQGSFDEQVIVGNSYPYLAAIVYNNNIFVGTQSLSTLNFLPTLAPGDNIQVLNTYTDPLSSQTTYKWYDASVTNYTTFRLTGNTIVTGNIGAYVAQSIASANATLANISSTTGTITLGGAQIVGTLSIAGNLITANVGDYITQAISGANATVTENVSLASVVNVLFNAGPFTLNSGNLRIKGANVASYPVAVTTSLQTALFNANVGDYITQSSSGANATIILSNGSFNSNIQNPYVLGVKYNSGTFITGSGNLKINGSNIATYPTQVICNTDLTVIYTTTNLFRLYQTDPSGMVTIGGISTGSFPSAIISVGVNVDTNINTQGVGFDVTRFDQGALTLPGTLTIDIDSGWITGFLPPQVAVTTDYSFVINVYKRDYTSYISSKLLTISIYGDLFNTINWLTPSYLGTIENGEVSDISLTAISSLGKIVYYEFTPGTYINLPQGLLLKPDGLISGRVSFNLFNLDSGYTTFDKDPFTDAPTTTFDHTFRFTVNAVTFDQTAVAKRTFYLIVIDRNITPYENLYLKALLQPYQQLEFRKILQDRSIFPSNLIYRGSDPWFGISQNIRTLFIPGLTPSTLEQYASALSTNHFTKRLLFGEVKTAVAKADGLYDVYITATDEIVGTWNIYTSTFVPLNFGLGLDVIVGSLPTGTAIGEQTIKYEVVYLEVLGENTPPPGEKNADIIDLNGVIVNPYLGPSGNSYVIATPNSFTNMDDAITDSISYANKGALPDWMTSTQPNGTELGFTRAVVLAYTIRGASETIAWRFKQKGYNLNSLNFTVDRYLLDNVYSDNYDINNNAFIQSRETTFDRYPPLENVFKYVATVDYAVSISYQSINERTKADIIAAGGLDGISNFQNGDTLVFYQQEYPGAFSISDTYNQGWADIQAPWSGAEGIEWDQDAWDQAGYVPGYNEWISSREVNGNVSTFSSPNQRIGIWKINIDDQDYVSLTMANITATVSSFSANTTGFGSNIKLSSTLDIFVGMPVRGSGLESNSSVTDVSGVNITVYPGHVSSVSGTLTFIPTPNYNNALFVRKGYTYGGTNIYYDPLIKTNNLIPNYSQIPQQIKTLSTIFDGNGTKFLDFRDTYRVPESGSNYLIFPRVNVFT